MSSACADRAIRRFDPREGPVRIVNVLIADDHPLFARALTLATHSVDAAINVVTVATLDAAERAVRERAFGLILLDLMLPDVEGFAGLLVMRAMAPATPTAIVSGRDGMTLMRQAARHGARGFLRKSLLLDQTASAIGVLLAGGQWFADEVLTDDGGDAATEDLDKRLGDLSIAQLRVMRAIASGRQNKQVAFELGLSEPTVKSHLAAVFRKLGVANRTQAVMAFKALDPSGDRVR